MASETWREWLDRVADETIAVGPDLNRRAEVQNFARHLRDAIIREEEASAIKSENPYFASKENPSSTESGWWADAKRAADQASEAIDREVLGTAERMNDQAVRAAAVQAAATLLANARAAYDEAVTVARELEEYIRNG